MTASTDAIGGVDARSPENPREAIDAELADFLEEERGHLLAVSADLAPVANLASDYLDGGKRLRPAFAYWGWRAAGGEPCLGIIRAAASLELLQACALIHDDVMDASDTRRGRPSAHRRFESHHAAADWDGNAEAFGSGAAILLGDLFLAWSDQLFSASGLPDEALRRGRPLFDAMRTELMAGQYLDLVVQSLPKPDRTAIGTVLRYKSAKYTIEHPLQLGALLGGADDGLVAGLSDFGLPLGEAFQLRDDLLGVFGDPAVTGKPAGDDLREGKQTLLIAVAFESSDEQQRDVLRAGLRNRDLDDDGVARIRDVLQSTGAVTAIEQEIGVRRDAAMQALARLELPVTARGALTALAEAAVKRIR